MMKTTKDREKIRAVEWSWWNTRGVRGLVFLCWSQRLCCYWLAECGADLHAWGAASVQHKESSRTAVQGGKLRSRLVLFVKEVFFFSKRWHSRVEIARFVVCVATYTAWLQALCSAQSICKCCWKVTATRSKCHKQRMREAWKSSALPAACWYHHSGQWFFLAGMHCSPVTSRTSHRSRQGEAVPHRHLHTWSSSSGMLPLGWGCSCSAVSPALPPL